MALRIVSEDGNGYNTKIFDAETGQDITSKLNAYRVEIVLPVDGAVSATISSWTPKTEIVVQEAQINRKCPYCGAETSEKIRSIEDLEGK